MSDPEKEAIMVLMSAILEREEEAQRQRRELLNLIERQSRMIGSLGKRLKQLEDSFHD